MSEPQTTTVTPPAPAAAQPSPAPAPRPAARPDPHNQSAQQRWLADKAAAEARDPWMDHSKALVKDAEGNLQQREVVTGPDGETTVGKPVGEQPGDGDPKPAAAADDATPVKVGPDLETTPAELRKLLELAAQDAQRKAGMPAESSGYVAKLPDTFPLPEGVAWKFNEADPALADFKRLSHSIGLSQQQFESVLSIEAARQIKQEQTIAAAKNAELAKLGATSAMRVDALTTFYRAHLGDAQGRQLMSRLFTAGDVEIAEKIMLKMQGGSSSFSQSGRVPPEQDGRLPSGPEGDRVWNSWSYSQQKAYSEQFLRPTGSHRQR